MNYRSMHDEIITLQKSSNFSIFALLSFTRVLCLWNFMMILTNLQYIQDIDMYREAADRYIKSHMFEHAARCYLKLKMWYEAAVYFEKGKKYDDAAIAYKDGGFYELVTDLIQR